MGVFLFISYNNRIFAKNKVMIAKYFNPLRKTHLGLVEYLEKELANKGDDIKMIEKIIKTRELTSKMTKEDLDNSYEHYLTVGKLKKFLEEHNLPDNAKVVVERVEDELFEFLYWYQRAPLDNKNQAEIVDIYLKDIRNEG